jgi:hypothetical protein
VSFTEILFRSAGACRFPTLSFPFIFPAAYEAAEKSPLPIATVLQRLNRLRKNAACWRNVEPQRLKPDPFSGLTVCLKAYPDTNPEFFRSLLTPWAAFLRRFAASSVELCSNENTRLTSAW